MEILDWRHSAAGTSQINALQSYPALCPLPSHEPHTRLSLIRVPLSIESFILPRPSLLFIDLLATRATLFPMTIWAIRCCAPSYRAEVTVAAIIHNL